MVVGGVLGGHLADRSVKRTIYFGMLALVGALLVTVFTAQWTWGVFLGAFLLGATSSAIPPAVQSRLMDVAATPARSRRRSTTPRSTSATRSVRPSAAR